MALKDQNGLDSCTCSPSPLYNWPIENGGAKERYFQIAKHCSTSSPGRFSLALGKAPWGRGWTLLQYGQSQSQLNLGRVALSAVGWYQKRPSPAIPVFRLIHRPVCSLFFILVPRAKRTRAGKWPHVWLRGNIIDSLWTGSLFAGKNREEREESWTNLIFRTAFTYPSKLSFLINFVCLFLIT